MTHRLATNYVKNYCNRTHIVKVIAENVVTCFLGTQWVVRMCGLRPLCDRLASVVCLSDCTECIVAKRCVAPHVGGVRLSTSERASHVRHHSVATGEFFVNTRRRRASVHKLTRQYSTGSQKSTRTLHSRRFHCTVRATMPMR